MPRLDGVCRICGCTENDCTECVERAGQSCYWIEANLCSACVGEHLLQQAARLVRHLRNLQGEDPLNYAIVEQCRVACLLAKRVKREAGAVPMPR